MSLRNWTQNLFGVENFESKKLNVLKMVSITSILIIALASSIVDQMQVLKHIWLAGFGSFAVFQVYRKIIFVKIAQEMNLSYDLKINSMLILLFYILSWFSGPGLLTAFFNLTSISACIMLIKPLVPRFYFPIFAAIIV